LIIELEEYYIKTEFHISQLISFNSHRLITLITVLVTTDLHTHAYVISSCSNHCGYKKIQRYRGYIRCYL